MNDVFFEVEQAYKELMSLWDESVRSIYPKTNKQATTSISYPRFKILRALSKGVKLVPDILYVTKIDRSTAHVMLYSMMEDGLVTQEHHDKRSFKWSLTLLGSTRVKELTKFHREFMEDAKNVIRENLKSMIRQRTNGVTQPHCSQEQASKPGPVQAE